MLYPALRRLLFRIDPESAHALVLGLARVAGAVPPFGRALATLFRPVRMRPVEAFGLTFANPVGLAAGYDKDALGWRGFAAFGFGHLEIGTVTPRKQLGNPRPRVFRLVEDRSLINRLGFPSRGAAFAAGRLGRARPRGLVVGVNLGKQKDTPLEQAADDYEELIGIFAPIADYLAINISSPNTPDLRRLQQRTWLQPLLERLVACRGAVPLLVKLSPDLTVTELDEALETISASGIDGVIATNTTTDRPPLRSRFAHETGGLSGAALTERSTAIVRHIHERTSGKLPIIACGGVMSPDDARAKLDAGACLVQLYTGLVYDGPSLIRRIVEELS